MAIGGGFEKEHQYHFLVFRLSDRKSTRLNSSHLVISYAVFCLKKKILEQSERAGPLAGEDRRVPLACRFVGVRLGQIQCACCHFPISSCHLDLGFAPAALEARW